MNFLLDTHTLIWFFGSDERLSPKAKQFIENPSYKKYFSVASIWEMGIKHSIGKLQLGMPLSEIVQHVQDNGIELINITEEHALRVGNLPLHHRDPFDRMIIAQCLCLDFGIIGKDKAFDLYLPLERIW